MNAHHHFGSALTPWIARVQVLVLTLALTACGGGSDSSATVEPPVAPTVASITATPASASIGVGQTQAVQALATDQHGAAMTGVSFTWASSNTSVVTVSGGIATGVAAGTASITASSGAVTSNPASLTVAVAVVGRVLIDKPSVLLAAVGQSAPLSAQVLDPQGGPSFGNVTWTSSAPDKVSVDASGRLVALAIGSAQVFAQAAGVRSAPTLVIVAQPQAGALLVTDAQVVSVGPPLRLAAGAVPGVGTEYEVTLRGVAAPAVGTLLIAAEMAPVAGKVVATRQGPAGLVVTLALVPLYQLFSDYDIRLNIDLSAFNFEAAPARAAAAVTKATLASTPVWTPELGKLALAATRSRTFFAPFQAWDCDASIAGQLASRTIELTLDNQLHLVLEDRPGFTRHTLEGSAEVRGKAGLGLKVGFSATGSCEAQGRLKVPIGGVFSMLVMPAVRFGLGAALNGEITLVQGDLSVEGSVGFRTELGWECGGLGAACRALKDIRLIDSFKTTSKIPSARDMQAKISGQFYVLARLDASFLFGSVDAKIVEARIGPKQSFDMAFEDDQVARLGYASSYALTLDLVVEPGAALKDAIKSVIGDDATSVRLELARSTPISESPKGTLSVSALRVRPGAPLDFTVELDPATVAYWVIGYNVAGVDLYRRALGEAAFTHWKFMDLIASNRATYRWVPVEADAGSYEFAALVKTKLEPMPLLEVSIDSVKRVDVSCFSSGPQSPLAAARLQAQAAPPSGAGATAQVLSCRNEWVGTASTVTRTPGSPPTDNITSTSRVTWRPDDTGGDNSIYTPNGSFTLAFNFTSQGCTTTLFPNTFTIDKIRGAGSKLFITQIPFGQSTYTISGAQFVDFTSTVSCPGQPDTVSELRNYLVVYADGSGPVTDQARLAGTYEDLQFTNKWDFALP
jgi:hypothetical protein